VSKSRKTAVALLLIASEGLVEGGQADVRGSREGEEEDEEDDMVMSALCPLGDDVLPISASALRLKQVGHKIAL
jgi:hypothetical protein